MSSPNALLCLEASAPNGGTWAAWEYGTIVASGEFSGRASAGLASSLASALPAITPPAEIRVGVGPGSFSGIRAALALAQGLALSWEARVVPIRSTHSIGLQFPEVTFLGVFSDARRGELFVTCYQRGRLARPSQVIRREDIDVWLSKCTKSVCTDGFDPSLPWVRPRALDLGRPLEAYGETEQLSLEPIHLRPALAQT
ncbi:MAG: hypothetical protein OHK005_06280 [Candidatus Methylacidiphilales bacterium]